MLSIKDCPALHSRPLEDLDLTPCRTSTRKYFNRQCASVSGIAWYEYRCSRRTFSLWTQMGELSSPSVKSYDDKDVSISYYLSISSSCWQYHSLPHLTRNLDRSKHSKAPCAIWRASHLTTLYSKTKRTLISVDSSLPTPRIAFYAKESTWPQIMCHRE